MKLTKLILTAVILIAVITPAHAIQNLGYEVNIPYGDSLGKDPVDPWVERTRNLSVYGVNVTLTTNEWEGLNNIGDTPIWPVASAEVLCWSTTANDAAAGTGIQTLTISGVDADCRYQSNTITLNGLFHIAAADDFLRINQIEAATVGTGLDADGTIKCYIGANLQLQIDPGDSHSKFAYSIIPTGILTNHPKRTGSLYSRVQLWWDGIVTGFGCMLNTNYRCRLNYQDLSNPITRTERTYSANSTQLKRVDFKYPAYYSQCTGVWIETYAETATNSAYGDMDMFIFRHETE